MYRTSKSIDMLNTLLTCFGLCVYGVGEVTANGYKSPPFVTLGIENRGPCTEPVHFFETWPH